MRPSGVKPRTMTSGPSQVIRRAGPPAAGISQTSGCASSRPTNAIHSPSGEIAGVDGSETPAVSRRAVPPRASTLHRSSSLTNRIVSRESAG